MSEREGESIFDYRQVRFTRSAGGVSIFDKRGPWRLEIQGDFSRDDLIAYAEELLALLNAKREDACMQAPSITPENGIEPAARASGITSQSGLKQADERKAFYKWCDEYNSRFKHWQFAPGSEMGRHCLAAWQARAALAAEVEPSRKPVAWVRWEWNRSGSKSLVFEKPENLSLSEQVRGVVYDPLYAAPTAPAEPRPAERKDEGFEHLKPFGYAPGGYMMLCKSCGEQVFDVDKRATRCKTCAEAAFGCHAPTAPAEASSEELEMINGLTEAETSETASVFGLTKCRNHQAGTQPVAEVEGFRLGSYCRDYKLRWLQNVPAGTKLYAAAPQAEPQPLTDEQARDQQEAPLEEWWTNDGQFLRAGGSEYVKTFAWTAWRAARGIGATVAEPAEPQAESKRGRNLLDEFLDEAARSGVTHLRLDVSKMWPEAAPKAEPQPLTDEQITAMRQAGYLDADDYPEAWAYERGFRDAERAHRIGTAPKGDA